MRCEGCSLLLVRSPHAAVRNHRRHGPRARRFDGEIEIARGRQLSAVFALNAEIIDACSIGNLVDAARHAIAGRHAKFPWAAFNTKVRRLPVAFPGPLPNYCFARP